MHFSLHNNRDTNWSFTL